MLSVEVVCPLFMVKNEVIDNNNRPFSILEAALLLFSSSIFLFLFLPLVIIGYRLIKERFQIYFLMLASLAFYFWGEPTFFLVILLSIALNYVFGMLLHISSDTKVFTRRLLLFLAVAGNLGFLYYFKYLNFALENINRFFMMNFAYRDIIMPIGISFFTFQGMSYVIDLYYKKIKVQKNPAYVAFYISFFPQLIAGPIVRYIGIEGQINQRTDSLGKFVEGAKRFILGLSKKTLIANTLGFVADQVFTNRATANTTSTAWVGIICYTFQIFFDFSGYSDMAIGLGKLFGFDFLENFNYPYISKTATEFWRRWHISLSLWFRDYLYIPLGGNRTGNVYVNLFIVFIATGFWHGASYNFIIWGLWHGLFLIIERVTEKTQVSNKKYVPLRWALTMLIVIIGWVLFRVEDLNEALKYLGIMFGIIKPVNVGFTVWYYLNAKTIFALLLAVVASIPLHEMRFIKLIRNHAAWEYAAPVAMLLLFFLSILFVVSSSYNPFIYFRF